MLLKTIFVRFYKSFNFDYLRKFHANAEPQPWELIGNMWYPFVRVPIDPKVTTIVGQRNRTRGLLSLLPILHG
jgi:hypothetical protein